MSGDGGEDVRRLRHSAGKRCSAVVASAALTCAALIDASSATLLAYAPWGGGGMHWTRRPTCNTIAYSALSYARAALALTALASSTSTAASVTRRWALALGGLQLFSCGFFTAVLFEASYSSEGPPPCVPQAWWLPLALTAFGVFASTVQSAALWIRVRSTRQLVFAKYHTLADAQGRVVEEFSDVGDATEPLLPTAIVPVPISRFASPVAAYSNSDSSFVSAPGSFADDDGINDDGDLESSFELGVPLEQHTTLMRQFCERVAGRWKKDFDATDDHDSLLKELDLGFLLRKAVRLLDEVNLSIVSHDGRPAFRTRVSFLVINIIEDAPLNGEKVEVKRRDMRSGYAKTWLSWDEANNELLQYHCPAARHAYEARQVTRLTLDGDRLLQDVRYELTRLRGVDVVPPRIHSLRTTFVRVS